MNSLTLDQMKNLSIDEIIELYKLGYKLEDNTINNTINTINNTINTINNTINTINNYENNILTTDNDIKINVQTDPSVDPFVNFGKVTVSTGYDAAATTIVLNPGDASKLPDISAGPFNLVWWNSTEYADPTDDPNREIVRVISVSTVTDTIIVMRGQEGTSPSPKDLINKTYRMVNALTSKTILDLQNVPAKYIKSSSGYIDVTSSTPTTGQILTATSPSSATWQSMAAPQCFFVSLVASPNSGPFPLPVNFNATVIGGTAPYTYSWTFGDGYTSTNPAPNHTFTTNGSFTTNLTVTDSIGNTATSATVISVTTGVGYVATGLGVIESLALPDSIIDFYNAGPTIIDSISMSDSLAGIYNASANGGSPLQDSISMSDSLAGIYNASANGGSPVQDNISRNESLTFTNS